MVSTLQKVSDVLTKIMRVVMVVLFIWMVVSLGIQVGARYIFHKLRLVGGIRPVLHDLDGLYRRH